MHFLEAQIQWLDASCVGVVCTDVLPASMQAQDHHFNDYCELMCVTHKGLLLFTYHKVMHLFFFIFILHLLPCTSLLKHYSAA